MAETRTGAGAVDTATLLADFVIPATVDMMIAAIDSDDINLDNLDAMFLKVNRALLTAAQKNVTADMKPYEPQESLYHMPEVTLLQHQITSSLSGDDVAYTIDAYEEGEPVPQSMTAAPAPAPRSPEATAASVRAIKAAATGFARPKPVQESDTPTLTPAYNRRKSDRQPTRTKAPARVIAPAEPKLKLPRGVKSVNDTIRYDVIICLEDGKKVADLGQHLAENHKLTPEAYRKKWSLPEEYPMKSPKLILTAGQVRMYQPVTGTFVPVNR